MSCFLCGFGLPPRPIVDNGSSFCCHGCHAVFQILSVKNALNGYQDHPVFKQALQAGLISNPFLVEEIHKRSEAAPSDHKVKLHVEIGDMWCPSCAEFIRLVLLQEKGVVKAVVDYSTDLASFEYSPFQTCKERIMMRIKEIGYTCSTLDTPEQRSVSFALYLRFIIAAFLSLNVMMFAYPIYASYFEFDEQGYGLLFSWFSFAASLPVATYCAWPIYRRAWSAALVGIIGMEALVTIGVLSAFIFSSYDLLRGGTQVYFDSMTVVVVFVLLGKIIESKAKFSAKSSLILLHKGLPKKGRKLSADGRWSFTPLKDIHRGDYIQVVMGEKFVLDGIVRKGGGVCDESLMTGEPMPVIKDVGDHVLAGSILLNGCVEVEVEGCHEKTVLTRILDMVESDIGHKSAYVRAVDPWARAFVPFVLITAGLVFFFWLPFNPETAITRMMAVLLISCPCAIGVAAPLAESHFIHALMNLGAVVRNRGVLRFLGKETAFVFDKTGTITHGAFTVFSGLDFLKINDKRILKAMTMQSMHPISKAIASKLICHPAKMEKIEECVGKGIKGVDGGIFYLLGSRSFLLQNGVAVDAVNSLMTTVFFAQNQTVLASIHLGDQLRSDAIQTISALRPVKQILLSGDAKSAVENIGRLCGFDRWFSEVSPLQKREVIESLKAAGEIVCVLGDGINDAPALTSAHIGISVMSATDISIQVSDIFLTTDRLDILPKMTVLAKKAHRIIRQNLFWAFFYNAIGILLAAAGVLSPIFAAGAMVASNFIVIFNAQRLSGAKIIELKDPSTGALRS